MNREEYYKIILKKVGIIFSEFLFIVESIKDNFEEEQKQHPALTMKVVDYHLNIVKQYANSYTNRIDTGWTLEKNIKYTKEDLRSFYREFDNPFRGSQRWYQRILELFDQMSQESRELERLLNKNT